MLAHLLQNGRARFLHAADLRRERRGRNAGVQHLQLLQIVPRLFQRGVQRLLARCEVVLRCGHHHHTGRDFFVRQKICARRNGTCAQKARQAVYGQHSRAHQKCARRNVQRQRGAYFLFHHFSCHRAASLPQRFMRMNVTIYITFKRFKMQEKPGMRPGFYTLFIICPRGIRNPQNHGAAGRDIPQKK